MCLLQVLWLVMQENICLLELAHGAKKSSWYHYHLYIDTLSVESNVHRGKPSLNITPKAQMIKSNILGKSVLCSKWKGKMPNEFPEHWDCSVLKSIGQWTLLHSLQRCSCYISFWIGWIQAQTMDLPTRSKGPRAFNRSSAQTLKILFSWSGDRYNNTIRIGP